MFEFSSSCQTKSTYPVTCSSDDRIRSWFDSFSIAFTGSWSTVLTRCWDMTFFSDDASTERTAGRQTSVRLSRNKTRVECRSLRCLWLESMHDQWCVAPWAYSSEPLNLIETRVMGYTHSSCWNIISRCGWRGRNGRWPTLRCEERLMTSATPRHITYLATLVCALFEQ